MTEPVSKANAPTPIAAHRTEATPAKDRAVSFLLLGAPGDGKTRFACGMPAPLFFCYDANMGTLERHPDIPYVVPDDFTDEGRNSAVAFSEKVLPLLEARRAHEIAGGEVRTIVVDSGTELLEALSDHIIGKSTASTNSLQKFGRYKSEGHELLRRLASLAKPKGDLPRYNVVVTIHLRDKTDSEGAVTKVVPAIMGALSGEAAKHFDCTLLLRRKVETVASTTPGKPNTKRTTYEAWSVPPERIYADTGLLDRMGGPPCVENPSYARYVELWEQS